MINKLSGSTIGWSVSGTRYIYIGDIPLLEGVTALGMHKDGFYVQVDDIQHPWSHGWHKITNIQDWKRI